MKRYAYPVLISEGGKGEYIYHLKRKPKISLTAVKHTIKLNDVRIHFEKACERKNNIKLVEFISEYKGRVDDEGMPRRLVEDSIEDPENYGEKVSFIPDAVICIENTKTKKRALFFLELDLGSEKLVAGGGGKYSVLKKMMLYRTYMSDRGFENYCERFKYRLKGFRVLTVMNGQQRIERLRRELTKRGVKRLVWFVDMDKINENNILEEIWEISDDKDDNKYSILGG